MVRGSEESFFADCVFEQPLRLMVKQGFLAAPKRLDMAIEGYDFSALAPSSSGLFREEELNRVVAGIPGGEGTVKHFRTEGETVVLVPANPAFSEERYPADEVTVFGKVVTVLRRI